MTFELLFIPGEYATKCIHSFIHYKDQESG